MITPKAFGHIIKHFDEIDKTVSARTIRKRPWSEIALTSLLCDLLDEETQQDEKLIYTFKNLQDDLKKEDGLFGIKLSLETIEFNPIYERYISQSDIGLKLIFDNEIEPQFSWTRPYLLQAKKLFPNKVNPLVYTEASRFTSVDKNQKSRIDLLNKIFEAPYLKYLLFSPRPDTIDNETKIKLSYLRNKKLSANIFDYTIGLEIHKEFLSSSETLKAGIFITDTNNSDLNFGQVHGEILNETFPFSWFIAMNFAERHDFLHVHDKLMQQSKSENQKLVEGILEGDRKKVDELIHKIEKERNDDFLTNIQVLPKHTITLKLSVGEQINSNNRNIRQE